MSRKIISAGLAAVALCIAVAGYLHISQKKQTTAAEVSPSVVQSQLQVSSEITAQALDPVPMTHNRQTLSAEKINLIQAIPTRAMGTSRTPL